MNLDETSDTEAPPFNKGGRTHSRSGSPWDECLPHKRRGQEDEAGSSLEPPPRERRRNRHPNPRSREDKGWKYYEKVSIDDSLFPPNVRPAAAIIGVRGSNHARLQDESGCCVQLRGRGISSVGTPGADEDLHLWVKYNTPDQLAKVKEVLHEIISTCDKGGLQHKRGRGADPKEQRATDSAASVPPSREAPRETAHRAMPPMKPRSPPNALIEFVWTVHLLCHSGERINLDTLKQQYELYFAFLFDIERFVPVHLGHREALGAFAKILTVDQTHHGVYLSSVLPANVSWKEFNLLNPELRAASRPPLTPTHGSPGILPWPSTATAPPRTAPTPQSLISIAQNLMSDQLPSILPSPKESDEVLPHPDSQMIDRFATSSLPPLLDSTPVLLDHHRPQDYSAAPLVSLHPTLAPPETPDAEMLPTNAPTPSVTTIGRHDVPNSPPLLLLQALHRLLTLRSEPLRVSEIQPAFVSEWGLPLDVSFFGESDLVPFLCSVPDVLEIKAHPGGQLVASAKTRPDFRSVADRLQSKVGNLPMHPPPKPEVAQPTTGSVDATTVLAVEPKVHDVVLPAPPPSCPISVAITAAKTTLSLIDTSDPVVANAVIQVQHLISGLENAPKDFVSPQVATQILQVTKEVERQALVTAAARK